jgi:hypothetical protein
MKSRAVLRLFDYWNRKRGGTPAPARTAIEPSDIRDVLRETFILHSTKPGTDLTFRLAGTALADLFGRELRDTALRALLPASHGPLFGRLMRNCISDSSVVLLSLKARSKAGRLAEIEMIFLPLQFEGGAPRILGCLSPVQPAFWYGLDPVAALSLDSIRLIDPDREPLYLANRPELKLPPQLSPTEAELEKLPQRGAHLRLIEGGLSGGDVK